MAAGSISANDAPEKTEPSTTWETKWGPRRVRHDPPTLAEAIAAAQGLTDNPTSQIEIAAELMGATPEEVRAEMQRLAPDRRATRLVEASSRDRGTRTVVVERKASRRVLAKEFVTRPSQPVTLTKR